MRRFFDVMNDFALPETKRENFIVDANGALNQATLITSSWGERRAARPDGGRHTPNDRILDRSDGINCQGMMPAWNYGTRPKVCCVRQHVLGAARGRDRQ